jgi:aldehyde:ferredoxin oxidoreductase
MKNILRIDVGAQDGPVATIEPVGRYAQLGGRLMTSTVVWEEVPADCDPLGAQNKLVISPGIMAGSSAPTSGRISVGCKSPLTGGIKEANSGGQAGQYLARLGFAAIIIEGERQGDALYKVCINAKETTITPCNDLRMLGNYELVEKLKAEHGDKVAMLSIGQAGEMQLANSTVAVTDPECRPTRHAARGGVGAVMGSKGIKAIVIDPEGTSVRKPVDPKNFKKAIKKLSQTVLASEMTGQGLPAFGTAMIIDVINEAGCYPAYNHSMGQFDKKDEISGETLAGLEEKRGGKGSATHGCQKGCIIRCSGTFKDIKGQFVTKQPEYETLWSHGGNCGIDDLDAIAKMDRMDDDFGLDTIETGCTMGVLMEAGELKFGDSEGVLKLLEEIGKGSEKGRLLGSGTATVAQHFGVERAPVVKGQSMSAYDARALKGLGVTYATSPMGADHTAGHTLANHFYGVEPVSDALDADNQLLPSAIAQISSAAIDATGFCLFMAYASIDKPQVVKYILDTMTAFTGLGYNENTFAALGIRILKMELDFNHRAGFSSKDDRLPEWMTREPLPPHNTVFDVSAETLDQVHNHTNVILQMLGEVRMGMAPPIALFGEGCHKMVPDNLAAMGVKKALIVTDKGVVGAGLCKILTDAMDAKFFEYEVYDGTEPNPTTQNVADALSIYRQEDCDCLVSLGGGSPHDCAKAVGIMANNPGNIIDYSGLFTVWRPLPILVAVTTTSGTGSEASFGVVISEPERHLKVVIGDPKVLPIVAVNDPLMTRTMPPHITAGTGFDALTHGIESYVSSLSTPYSKGLSINGIRLITENLAQAVENGNDMDARANMCQGQYSVALAMNSAQLGNTHSLAHPLSALYNMPHGDANALMLPHVMRKNKPAILNELAEIAVVMGKDITGLTPEAAADKAIEAVQELMERVKVSKTITELATRCKTKINATDILELVSRAVADPCCGANPIVYSPDDFEEIYKNTWE